MPKPQQQTKNIVSDEITIKSTEQKPTETITQKMNPKETSTTSTPQKSVAKRAKKETTTTSITLSPVEPDVVDAPIENVAMEVTKDLDVVVSVATTKPAGACTNEFYEQSHELQGQMQQLANLFNTVRRNFVALERNYTKNLRAAQKASRSAKFRRSAGFDKKGGVGGASGDVPAAPRAPSGFVKPTLISDELAAFLGKDAGKTEMARTSVTKEINQYIRENNLQDKTNGRRIIPDDKLRLLLKLPVGEELTYFNLQKFMRVHFPLSKTMAAANAAAAAAALSVNASVSAGTA